MDKPVCNHFEGLFVDVFPDFWSCPIWWHGNRRSRRVFEVGTELDDRGFSVIPVVFAECISMSHFQEVLEFLFAFPGLLADVGVVDFKWHGTRGDFLIWWRRCILWLWGLRG